MNNLLIFFAYPVAVIILAIVLQRILNSPLLVAGTFFAIFLVITFAVYDQSFLLYAILYAFIALVTAIIARLVCCIINNEGQIQIGRRSILTQDYSKSESTDEECSSTNQETTSNYSNSYNKGTNGQSQYFGRRYMFRR